MIYVKDDSRHTSLIRDNFECSDKVKTKLNNSISNAYKYITNMTKYVTDTVTNKVPPMPTKILVGFEPLSDVFVSVHQRTAGNGYNTYYGGCVYQLHNSRTI